jgi:catechol 2,3-dioxygenase-like lactoylglutathione lyase family enzyme
MIDSLDHLIIAVKDLDEATKNYEILLGNEPVWQGEHKAYGTANTLFNFENTYLELLAAKGEGFGADLINYMLNEDGEGLAGLVLSTEDANKTLKSLASLGYDIAEPAEGEGINYTNSKKRKWKNLFLPPELTRGIFAFLIEHKEGSLDLPLLNKDSIHKLDHLVINTNDADGFVEIYQNIYGIRLALDKVIDAWNKRMLFFRLNKTTIEVIEEKDTNPPADKLWGLAWSVKNLNETHARLKKAGVDISEIKPGIKENTKVATVKSHTHNVPTLLIEHIN